MKEQNLQLFYQLRPYHFVAPRRGTGFGLSLSDNTIKAHGGVIKVETK